MFPSMKSLARGAAIAAFTASTVAIGAGSSQAAPAVAPAVQHIQTHDVSATADPASQTITATLTAGKFVHNTARQAIEVVNPAGQVTETIPLTVAGQQAPLTTTISNNGATLLLHKADVGSNLNKLSTQWLWGVQNGGGVGAVIGCLIGLLLFFLGCLVGIALGGAMASPNSGQINATFNDLISGR